MIGEVPPILWYLLLAVIFTVFPWGMVLTIHRQRMKALEILRTYAERGVEPPPGIAEPLMRALKEPVAARRSARARRLDGFVFSLFMAGASAGIAWWRQDAGADPRWLFYAAVVAAAAFAAGALGALVAALSSPRD